MSEQFEQWLAALSPENREKFSDMMKDDNTYVADSVEDVLAVLGQIKEEKNKH